MAKNIKLWARAEFCSASTLYSAASDTSLSSPAISASHVPRDIWNHITKAPQCCLSLKSSRQPQTGLARPLEISPILPVRWAHVNTPPALAGNQFLLCFFLPWEICLFLASIPSYPASYAETKKLFHFSSHLSHFSEKLLELLLHRHADSFVFLLFKYLKLFTFACRIFLLSSLHCPLILFGTLMPYFLTSFDGI